MVAKSPPRTHATDDPSAAPKTTAAQTRAKRALLQAAEQDGGEQSIALQMSQSQGFQTPSPAAAPPSAQGGVEDTPVRLAEARQAQLKRIQAAAEPYQELGGVFAKLGCPEAQEVVNGMLAGKRFPEVGVHAQSEFAALSHAANKVEQAGFKLQVEMYKFVQYLDDPKAPLVQPATLPQVMDRALGAAHDSAGDKVRTPLRRALADWKKSARGFNQELAALRAMGPPAHICESVAGCWAWLGWISHGEVPGVASKSEDDYQGITQVYPQDCWWNATQLEDKAQSVEDLAAQLTHDSGWGVFRQVQEWFGRLIYDIGQASPIMHGALQQLDVGPRYAVTLASVLSDNRCMAKKDADQRAHVQMRKQVLEAASKWADTAAGKRLRGIAEKMYGKRTEQGVDNKQNAIGPNDKSKPEGADDDKPSAGEKYVSAQDTEDFLESILGDSAEDPERSPDRRRTSVGEETALRRSPRVLAREQQSGEKAERAGQRTGKQSGMSISPCLKSNSAYSNKQDRRTKAVVVPMSSSPPPATSGAANDSGRKRGRSGDDAADRDVHGLRPHSFQPRSKGIAWGQNEYHPPSSEEDSEEEETGRIRPRRLQPEFKRCRRSERRDREQPRSSGTSTALNELRERGGIFHCLPTGQSFREQTIDEIMRSVEPSTKAKAQFAMLANLIAAAGRVPYQRTQIQQAIILLVYITDRAPVSHKEGKAQTGEVLKKLNALLSPQEERSDTEGEWDFVTKALGSRTSFTKTALQYTLRLKAAAAALPESADIERAKVQKRHFQVSKFMAEMQRTDFTKLQKLMMKELEDLSSAEADIGLADLAPLDVKHETA